MLFAWARLARVYCLWREDNSCMSRNAPVLLGFDRRRSRAAVARVFARPDQLPTMAFERRQERLRRGIQVQVESEVDDDEALEFGILVLVASEKAQDKRFLSEHGTFQTVPTRIGKDWIGSAQSEQVAMHLIDFGMLLAFREVEFAFSECFLGFRIDEDRFAFRAGDAWELLEKVLATFADELRQFWIVICKIIERRRCPEFLALKEHRGARPEQH